VRRVAGPALVAATGIATAFLASTGAYAAYLKPSMRFPLLGAGLTMAAVGMWTLAHGLVAAPDDGDATPGDGAAPAGGPAGHHDDGDGDAHEHHLPRVAWLLALPLVAAVLLQPPALGADAARREAATVSRPAAGAGFAPLPAPRDGAVDLRLGDIIARARFDPGRTLAGVPVRLTGFVVRDPDIDDGYHLTRFAMACCAGDALPLAVEVRGLDAPPPPDDTWVDVVGTWADTGTGRTGDGASDPVRLDLHVQATIEAPTFPYE
jgi:uncharacterized repeat protein (TIGR03943 family)